MKPYVSMIFLLLFASPASAQPMNCSFTVGPNGANLRSGAGAEFVLEQTSEAGETLTVVGRAAGDDGYVWWETSQGWVRSDLGESDCPSLCGDGVCEYGEDTETCSRDCQVTDDSESGLFTDTCLVPDCESCYETIWCYPDCNECSCDENAFGCTTCYCEFPDALSGTTSQTTSATVNCTFTAQTSGVNIRVGPGVTYALEGSLDGGDSLTIISRDVGADAYVWWESARGWVRSDLGESDCPSLCGDGVCEYGEDINNCANDCGSRVSTPTNSSTISSSDSTCEVTDCEACYETIWCYPNCNDCSCTTNEFGCTECYCSF